MWGAAGLSLAAGLAGWLEMIMLRHTLSRRIGRIALPPAYAAKLWGSALAGAAAGLALKIGIPTMHPVIFAAIVLGAYGLVFLAATMTLRIPEASAVLERVARVRR
jgi:putative peptidoglycan lipid II flippase